MPDSIFSDRRGDQPGQGMVTLAQDRDFRAAEETGNFFLLEEKPSCDKVLPRRQKGWKDTLWTHPFFEREEKDSTGRFGCSCIPNDSNLLFLTSFFRATVAQSVEHLTRNCPGEHSYS